MDDVLQKLTIGALGLLYAIGWWVWNRSIKRRDDIEARVMVLEKHSITRAELEQTIREAAADRRAMHDDNQETLKEIRSMIEKNEERRSRTEHAILNTVNSLNLKVHINEEATKRIERRE